MFYLVFGLIWTILCSIMIHGFYDPNSADTIIVNGETVTYEEFTHILWPKLFLGFALLIGIVILLIGLRIVIRDFITNISGKKTIGLLLSIEPNGQTINDQIVYDAVFLVLEENGDCNVYRKNIGTNFSDYFPNEFYAVRHYKKNITVISHIDENMIPIDKTNILKNALYSDKNPYYLV